MNIYGIARFTKDVEVTYSPSGTAFLNNSLAWNRKYDNEDIPNFLPCVFSGKNAENVAKFFNKGEQIFIKNGELQMKSWEDNDGKQHSKIEVFVKEWGFCGGNKNNSVDNSNTANLDVPPDGDPNDDDLPF